MLKSTARLGQAMIVYALTGCCWADQLLTPNTQKLELLTHLVYCATKLVYIIY